VLLDDVFTGLDHKTAAYVFQQLLGDEGIFKQGKQTVVLATNQRMPSFLGIIPCKLLFALFLEIFLFSCKKTCLVSWTLYLISGP
jgi:hypothetical protein